MKIGIICGSHRANSESGRIGRYVEKRIKSQVSGSETFLFDLAGNPLPLWDESVWDGDEAWKKRWDPIASELSSCDSYVVISPEWGGMVPAGLKNFFLLCNAKVVGHKPALIVTVSAARGGSYPVDELRISSYKNSRLCYIPEHVIVRDCKNMFKSDTAADDTDGYMRKRMDYSLKLLAGYGTALKQVRESGVVNLEDFPNGM